MNGERQMAFLGRKECRWDANWYLIDELGFHEPISESLELTGASWLDSCTLELRLELWRVFSSKKPHLSSFTLRLLRLLWFFDLSTC